MARLAGFEPATTWFEATLFFSNKNNDFTHLAYLAVPQSGDHNKRKRFKVQQLKFYRGTENMYKNNTTPKILLRASYYCATIFQQASQEFEPKLAPRVQAHSSAKQQLSNSLNAYKRVKTPTKIHEKYTVLNAGCFA